MNLAQRKELDRLTEVTTQAQDYAKRLADHMGRVGLGGAKISDERWEQLFKSLSDATRRMESAQKELEAAAKAAGLPV